MLHNTLEKILRLLAHKKKCYFQLNWALDCNLDDWNLEKTTSTTTTTTTATTTSTTTTSSTTTSTTTTTTSTTKRLSNFPCIVDNPLIQYCYTIPDEYTRRDNYDYNDNYYHVDEDFNVGNTFRFSKACSGDWYWPGTNNQLSDGSRRTHCDNMPSYFCDWGLEDALVFAVPSPDGYITVLNCPKCGCTPGQNDVITVDQIKCKYC